MTLSSFRMTCGCWGRIKKSFPRRIRNWHLWAPSGMEGLHSHYLKTQNCVFKNESCSPGGPIPCFKPERGFTWTASVYPVSGLKNNRKLWFSVESYPSPTVRPYHLGESDPTACYRVGHTGIHSASHRAGSGMDMWPRGNEEDSVLRNSFGKRESLSIEGCWEDRKMA